MASTFAALGTDNIGTTVECLLYVFGMTDHVHVEDTMLVEFLNNMLWWDTDGRDKELSTRLNDNVNELVKLTLGVIVAVQKLVN